MIFDNNKPKTLWEDRIKEILQTHSKTEMEQLIDLVSMVIYNQGNDDLSRLYYDVGLESFSKIIALFSQRTIKFPDREEFQDLLMTALCYYYKEVQKMSWDEIKAIFNFKEFSSIKYGKGIAKLNAVIGDSVRDQLIHIYEGK